jgi:hypothetical protein
MNADEIAEHMSRAVLGMGRSDPRDDIALLVLRIVA